MKEMLVRFLCLFLALLPLRAQHFNFQGQLTDDGLPASGNFDFIFSLFDASTGGKQLGSSIAANGIDVRQGILATH